ncbi:hypothetical protein [Streptomyces sp. NPDC003395]
MGTDLVHALDYVVMLQVMFNLASGIKSTPMTVWKQLQARGIRSAKNVKTLVGRDAVYEAFSRLVDAGYLRRTQLPHPDLPGRLGPVVYETFDNPAWNPEWQARQAGTDPLTEAEKNPQVGTLPGTPDAVTPEAGKTAGRNASRNAGSGNAGSGVPGSVNRAVPAGQDASGVPGSGIGLPPHPPEEEDSSSPYPLGSNTGTVPSQREEAEFSPEEISGAEAFLQQMQQWQAGGTTARKCAPRLLRALRKQGWPSLAEMDAEHRALLEADIFKNTGGAVSWAKCLPGWIDDLRLYAVVRPQDGPSGTGSGMGAAAAQAALKAACTACDRNGWVLDDDDDAPMRRCTHPGVTAQAGGEQ